MASFGSDPVRSSLLLASSFGVDCSEHAVQWQVSQLLEEMKRISITWSAFFSFYFLKNYYWHYYKCSPFLPVFSSPPSPCPPWPSLRYCLCPWAMHIYIYTLWLISSTPASPLPSVICQCVHVSISLAVFCLSVYFLH